MAVYNFNEYPAEDYVKAIKSQIIRPRFRISLLNQDESFRMDISDYIMNGSGSLSISYQQGQRRSLNFILNNIDGLFTPNVMGLLWVNTKFKLELGIELSNGDIIYNPAGIFVLGNPNTVRQAAQRTISIQCYDKFALLDGTLGGKLETTYLINEGTKVLQAVQDTLLQDNGNGYPVDLTPLVFDSAFKDATVQYDISKSPNESIGDMLIELANMLSADIYYGVNGNLIFKSGIKDISQVSKPTLWTFDDTEYEYLESSITYDFTSIKNCVTVAGANTNGDLVYVATANNTNPQSPTRISLIGKRQYYIEDSNIYSDELAQDRAEYELNRLSILQNTININAAYMIHLDVNSCIAINDEYFEYYDTRFIIQDINIPISVNAIIDINCTNIALLPYYPSS